MLNWLSSIGDAIGIFVQFVTSLVTGIISVFGLVGEAFIFLNTAYAYMPSVLLVFVGAGITISVVFHLIGR